MAVAPNVILETDLYPRYHLGIGPERQLRIEDSETGDPVILTQEMIRSPNWDMNDIVAHLNKLNTLSIWKERGMIPTIEVYCEHHTFLCGHCYRFLTNYITGLVPLAILFDKKGISLGRR